MVVASRMTMTPTWLAIREAARRWLRAAQVNVEGSQNLLGALQEIGPRISDRNPRIVQVVDMAVSNGQDVFQVHLDGVLSFRFGGDEPGMSACWVMDVNPARLQEFAITLLDLASSGYPGCASCGGSDEGSWNEHSSRVEQAIEVGNDS